MKLYTICVAFTYNFSTFLYGNISTSIRNYCWHSYKQQGTKFDTWQENIYIISGNLLLIHNAISYTRGRTIFQLFLSCSSVFTKQVFLTCNKQVYFKKEKLESIRVLHRSVFMDVSHVFYYLTIKQLSKLFPQFFDKERLRIFSFIDIIFVGVPL